MATANTRAEVGKERNFEEKNITQAENKPTEGGINKESLKQTANETLSQVKEKTTNLLSEQKENLTAGLSSVADSIRQVGENLQNTNEPNKIGQVTAQYSSDLARQLDKFSRYIENADFRDLARDLESYARRQPALFIGGAFTLGLLAARFLKTSHPTQFIQETIRENKPERRGQTDLTTQTV